MIKPEKLLASIRNNPKSVRFDDACKIAERLNRAARVRIELTARLMKNSC